ncbi:MAG TPA: hypothetical protein VKS24_22905 [Bradyrhizobium sp.]|nr:hypothetical protein [Bradyrhizobium sp.]
MTGNFAVSGLNFRRLRVVCAAVAFFLGSGPLAFACPNLSGTFLCPGWQTQPPQKLLVTTIFKPDGSATYQFKYVKESGEASDGGGDASFQGIKDSKGTVRTCTRYEMINKGPNDKGQGTANFINAEGNFEAGYGGKTQIICIRQN